MTQGDAYRTKAAELRAQAKREATHSIRTELDSLALGYLRLAEQAERNSLTDVSYETPPAKTEPKKEPKSPE